MQYARFVNGGYVLHRMTGMWVGRVSAWFDKNGALIDAEQILPNGNSRPVRMGTPMWREIKARGGPLADVLPAAPCGTTEFVNAGAATA